MKLNVFISDLKDQQNIVGVKNNNLKAIEEVFNCEISLRGDSIYTNCREEEIGLLEEIFSLLNEISKLDYVISDRDIIYICNSIKNGKKDNILELYNKPLTVGRKVNGKTKKSIYVLPKIEGNSVSPKIIELFRQVTLSIEAANNLLVIKTLAGNAGTAGMAIDHMGINNILGTIAGDDTLLIVAKTEKDAKIIEKGLKKI
jgi:hypothetical protein